MNFKTLSILLTGLLPASRLKNFLLRRNGWKIEPEVKIGPNIFIKTSNVKLQKRAEIRPFNIFRNISLEIGSNSVLGSFNWIGSAIALSGLPNYRGILSLGEHSAVNSRNYFDVSGGVYIGNFSDLAGVRSTFVTHQIDLERAAQTCNEIRIGSHTMICSNSLFVPGGTNIGERCLFAMGSVIRAGTYPTGGFYAGTPAVLKKQTSGDWFFRDSGKVE